MKAYISLVFFFISVVHAQRMISNPDFPYSKSAVIELESVKIREDTNRANKMTSKYLKIKFRIRNRYQSKIVVFPSDYGRFMGLYRFRFVSGNDTISPREFSDIDFACYSPKRNDTILPSKTKHDSINFSYFQNEGDKSINIVDKIKSNTKISIEYKMGYNFDTLFPKENCPKYTKLHLKSKYFEIGSLIQDSSSDHTDPNTASKKM